MTSERQLTIEGGRSELDRAFYDNVRAAKPRYNLVDRFIIPPLNGRGVIVKKGHTFRVIEEEGPQAAAVAFWNAENPKERYAPMRNRTAEGLYINVYTRLWSDVPSFRPMMTCVEDTVVNASADAGYHHHWVVASRCSSESLEMRSGRAGMNSCHLNLLQAIEPFGLSEEYHWESINIHQKVRLSPDDGKWYGTRSDSKQGDYLEFYAEIDLLVAVSVCPYGDNARFDSTPADDAVLPLSVEIYDTGIEPKESPKWTDWRPSWTGKWIPPQS